MSSRLEQFVNDHREEFDSEEPSKKIWDKIQDKMDPQPVQAAPKIIKFRFAQWSAAAAVIVAAATGIWYFNHGHGTKTPDTSIAGNAAKPDNGKISNPGTKPDTTAIAIPKQELAQNNPEVKKPIKKEPVQKTDSSEIGDYQEEMMHYARLVEIKHNQLKRIEKNEPLLYKQFASDVDKLDKVYHSLEQQLPKNPNQEQLLEAMIHNLQLQMKLLNHQLDIIKQINHSKKTVYEKAYQSI